MSFNDRSSPVSLPRWVASRGLTAYAVHFVVAGTHQDWDTEFRRRLSPGSLVQLLTVGEERLLRAEYLVTIKAQHKQSMLYTIQVQKAHTFKKKFPGFEKWHREREQNQLTADDEVE